MTAVSTSKALLKTETWASLGDLTWSDPAVAAVPWSSMTQYLHTVAVQESLLLVEMASKLSAISIASKLNVAALASKASSVELLDGLGLSDDQAFGVAQSIKESLIVAELASKRFARPLFDGFGIVGGDVTKASGVNALVDLGIGDGDKVARDISLNRQERLIVEGALSNGVDVQLARLLTLGDSIVKKAMPNILQSLGFAEAEIKRVEARWNTAIAIVELASKKAHVQRSTTLNVAEALVKSFHQDNLQSIAFAESFGRIVNFVRNYAESVSLTDSTAKLFRKVEHRDLNIAEAMVVPAMMVIGDMLVNELGDGQSFTENDFLQSLDTGAIPGWTAWRNFVPGDYEYSKAMFRTVMDSVSADRAQIEDCVVAVDVPDVIDRGAARVTAAVTGVYVEFNREYHVVPEITLTARGGLNNPTAAELIGSPSLLGFTARLRDTVTGDYVAGTFTWASHGY